MLFISLLTASPFLGVEENDLNTFDFTTIDRDMETSAVGEYIKGTLEDSRTPCPFINALANHGYINRNGRDIVLNEFQKVLEKKANIGGTVAGLLVGFVKSKSTKNAQGQDVFDLRVLNEHNFIEHDTSLTRKDLSVEPVQDNVAVDLELVDQLLSYSEDGYLTVENIVEARQQRHQQCRSGPGFGMNDQNWFTANGETIFLASVMGGALSGDKDKISVDYVKSFFIEEKFPEGWAPRRSNLGVLPFMSKIDWVKRLQKDFQQ